MQIFYTNGENQAKINGCTRLTHDERVLIAQWCLPGVIAVK
jgi:hypothetical protein